MMSEQDRMMNKMADETPRSASALPHNAEADEEHLRPTQAEIDLALEIERQVPTQRWNLYLECLNGKPMSERTSAREQRNGCILTHHVYRSCADD